MTAQQSYTTEEIAQLLKISKLTVYDLIKKGDLPAYRVGRQMRIDANDLKVYKERAKSNFQTTNDSQNNETSVFNDSLYQQPISSPTNRRHIIISGQDLALDLLSKHIEKKSSIFRPLRANSGSLNSLISMYHGGCHVVSTHLYDSDTQEFNLPYVSKVLSGQHYIMINLISRWAGFYVQKGNPKQIKSWADLTQKDVTLINREKGSGARILLDEHLKQHHISSHNILGYDHEESSHLGVAAVIANGDADVGIGTEKTAHIIGIDFIPTIKERYDLVILKNDDNILLINLLKEIINSTAFKNELQYIGGYDLSKTGNIIYET